MAAPITASTAAVAQRGRRRIQTAHVEAFLKNYGAGEKAGP